MKIRIKTTRGKMLLPQTRLTALTGEEFFQHAASRIPDQATLNRIIERIPADQRRTAYDQIAPMLSFYPTESPSLPGIYDASL